jgi:Protein of unknown function (DUF3379)
VRCEEARLLIGADPGSNDPQLEAHRHECAGCANFREEMLALDANIRRALEKPPQLQRAPRRTPLWRQFALAASIVAALILGAALWGLRPSASLAHEVIVHVQDEPDSWFAKEHVSAAGIDAALQKAGVRLDINSDRIMYSQSCFFRGHYVPHLVVQTTHGPATLMILKHEKVRGRQSFHEAGLTGEIVPVGDGSIAVLARGDDNIALIAGQMQHVVHWVPDTN